MEFKVIVAPVRGAWTDSRTRSNTNRLGSLAFLRAETSAEEHMQTISYYKTHAERLERLASGISDPKMIETLDRLSKDYGDIALDLERGAIVIVHPERVPQQPD
jgi:hypothetical protein